MAEDILWVIKFNLLIWQLNIENLLLFFKKAMFGCLGSDVISIRNYKEGSKQSYVVEICQD